MSSPPTASVNKWIVAATVLFGTFMAVMDISVVNVAMPHMMGTFGEDLSSITWVATGYSIAEIIMVTMAGWWSAVFGRKRFYLASFALFIVGSALCGLARTFPLMITFRVIQGIGGGALIPISQAILRETFPPKEQGMAMAIYGMGVVLAPALGPVLGGWLTDHYGWPWVFFINLPVGIVGIMMIQAFLKDPPYLKRGIKRIDWGGIALLGICLTSMQIVLERGQEKNWFDSPFIVAGSVICVISTVMLVIWEMTEDEPIVNFRILKNVPLSIGSIVGVVFGIGLFGSTFILPQFTQVLLGYPAFQAGLVLLPRGLILLCCMPIVGWLYNRVDPRISVLFGIGLLTWSFWDLSRLELGADFWGLVPMMVIMGAGMPFVFVTLTTVSLSTIAKEEMTEASSIYTLSRRVGGNIGYALVATLVARNHQIQHSNLSANITALNPNFNEFQRHTMNVLHTQGLSDFVASRAATGLSDYIINQQALMLSYNDTMLFMGALFVITVPLIFLIPGPKVLRAHH